MLIIDPTAWDGLTGDDFPDACPFEAMIVWALISSALLLVGGLGFWLGRVTA